MIELNLKNSKIFIENGLKAKLNDFIDYNKVLIITDDNVFKFYKNKISIKNSTVFVIKNGEKSKNFDIYKKITDKAIEAELDRKSAIVALGGGVVGDLAGFVASTYLRGIDFIQIPTTLLAQVDSSIGGKTGINHKFGKNLIGTFYQPKMTLIDSEFLNTLPEKEFQCGLGEILKYAFIEKSCKCNEYFDLWRFLIENKQLILNKKPEILTELIKICCSLKTSVVEKDEKEQNLRAILNFGHTFAHSIEKITNYNKFAHGEAVAIGIKMAFNKAYIEQKIDLNYYNAALELLGLYKLDKVFENKGLFKSMKNDKKSKDGIVHFVLPICSQEVAVF